MVECLEPDRRNSEKRRKESLSMDLMNLALVAGVIGLAFAVFMTTRVLKQDEGPEEVRSIVTAVREGALAFLRREYTLLGGFVVLITILLGLLSTLIDAMTIGTAISYLVGAILSALAGFLGMSLAIRANGRTAAAAMQGLNAGLRVSFGSGTVMGMTVVSFGLLGVTVLYLIFQDIEAVAGFSFGASSIALFARVGGGIFTKAADVGADLVGKVEAGIPEDDPRNPATIADNVGDNVGDVAGMGADLFESYVGSIIATIAIGAVFVSDWNAMVLVLPLGIASIGIICSLIGTFFVRSSEDASFGSLLWALRRGIFIAAALVVICTGGLIAAVESELTEALPDGIGAWDVFFAVVSGLGAGVIIGVATEYYTSYDNKPTKRVAENAETGPATVIIEGLALGMESTIIPVVTISAAVLLAYGFAGFYGVAIAAVGMLSTLGITLATDAYGPVADNAGGIAEQAGLPKEVRERTDSLDALGNTTAATGKGFAIGSAGLTSLALMVAYTQAVGIDVISLLKPQTLVGLMIGAMLPFVFSSMTMRAVGRAAFTIINEVRRQFREIPGIMERTGRPDYARCVDIATRGALREMLLPGALAITSPLLMGVILGPEALGGMLMGAISSGFMLAIMMANAGGAWDNAKKYIELGNLGGKGSEQHKAGVVGDTVGDPFKDTSGPSLNILLKLMSVVALVLAPLFAEITPLI